MDTLSQLKFAMQQAGFEWKYTPGDESVDGEVEIDDLVHIQVTECGEMGVGRWADHSKQVMYHWPMTSDVDMVMIWLADAHSSEWQTRCQQANNPPRYRLKFTR
jgi:hypothetical protein